MNREPKISEIQKLLNHFRETDREHELLEVLKTHNIGSKDPMQTIDPDTHEINEEALVFKNIALKEGLEIIKVNPLKRIQDIFVHKWYVRYFFYYIGIFLSLMAFLNLPILLEQTKKPDETKARFLTVQEIERVPMASSAPLDAGEVIPENTQLIIPKIGVTAPVIFLNTTEEAIMQDNLTRGLVHYAGTAEPGKVGNSFITGHSSNFWWIKGNYNYIFANLNKLAVGDQAKIYHKKNKFVYQVREVKVVEPNDTTVLEQTDTPTLTLMTCTPPGTNWKRLIVVFDQVSPKYEKPRVVTKQILDKPDRLVSTDSNSTGGVLLEISEWVRGLFTGS